MNIPRYLLPASIAATLHIALLWAIPHEEYTRLIPVILGPKDPPPPKPPEDIPLPPPEKGVATEPVRELGGGPPPPENPEPPVGKLPPDALIIPVDPRPHYKGESTKIIPPAFGPGEIGTPGGPGGPIFAPGELDRVPNARVQIAPEYPFAMKNGGIDGSVTVEFDVDRAGNVVAARVLRSTHVEFEAPTLRAVAKWRFEPGKRNGRTVPFRLVVPVDFHLGE